MEAADEICAEPGVDGIFIGPNDLTAAYGHLGDPNHPEVQAAVAQIYDAANRAGKAIGTRPAGWRTRRPLHRHGRAFRCRGAGHTLLRDASRALRERLRNDAISIDGTPT